MRWRGGLGIQTSGRLLGDVLDDIASKTGIPRGDRLYGAFIRRLYAALVNGEDATLSGNPLMLKNCIGGKPLGALHVYGKSTQNGVPTPTAPVPIVSAGDGGTVTVTVSDGANESQTLTLQTPNALPGIPVTSGGNYTDESGQQWVCDEVDLARGVRVQRIGHYTPTNITIHGFDNIADVYLIENANELREKASGTVRSLLCTDYKNNHVDAWAKKENRVSWSGDPHRQLRVYDERDQAEVLETLNSGKIRIDYVLDDPVETPLTSAEIAAYKALTTYAPTTVITANGVAGLKATYRRARAAKDT